ncbi:MAG: hypothetical protein IPJ65_15440 [Archangiaceae bacterium]|nr:hypothetical protein [Archangiaceae bacterium]
MPPVAEITRTSLHGILIALTLTACGGTPVQGGEGGGGPAGGQGGSSGGTAGGSGGSGGGTVAAGAFCAPCADSTDCAAPALCLGNPGHCGAACASGQPCASGSTCTSIGLGKVILGRQCMPAATACDLSTRPTLDCSDTWANWAQAFFADNCRSCHRHDLDFDTQANVLAQAEVVRLAVETRNMPPAIDLGAGTRRRLAVWLSCAAGSPPSAIH